MPAWRCTLYNCDFNTYRYLWPENRVIKLFFAPYLLKEEPITASLRENIECDRCRK